MRIYTSAPKMYDGFGTHTVRIVGRDTRTDEPVREVEIAPWHYDWQVMRYASGSHLYTTRDGLHTLESYAWLGDWAIAHEVIAKPRTA